MNKAAREVAYFLNNRPLCFLSTVFAIREILIGIGLLFAVHDVSRTLLFHNLSQLGGAGIYGVILIVIGVMQAVTAIADKSRWTRWALEAGSWFWLFACCTYLFNGNWLPSLIYLFMCSIPSGYIAFYYKWRNIWDEPKRKWRLKYGLKALS
jgi:uncharacterized membrane protein HdeD (DUF308 family)